MKVESIFIDDKSDFDLKPFLLSRKLLYRLGKIAGWAWFHNDTECEIH